MNIQKWEMLVSGRVQGVGFRYTSQVVAKRHDVVGWVQNLEDGRVELHVQGRPDELERYLDALESAILGQIKGIEKVVAAAELSLRGFEIRT